MALSRDSRQEQKLKAIRRAEFRLKQRLDAIDFENDVLMPEIEKLKSGGSVLGLPEGVVFDIHIDADHHTPTPAAESPVHRVRSRPSRPRARRRWFSRVDCAR